MISWKASTGSGRDSRSWQPDPGWMGSGANPGSGSRAFDLGLSLDRMRFMGKIQCEQRGTVGPLEESRCGRDSRGSLKVSLILRDLDAVLLQMFDP